MVLTILMLLMARVPRHVKLITDGHILNDLCHNLPIFYAVFFAIEGKEEQKHFLFNESPLFNDTFPIVYCFRKRTADKVFVLSSLNEYSGIV